MSELKLTVQDVLQRKSFRCAKVVAGLNGLNRQVKWTHILETPHFESFINGGELILTTGAGLQLEQASQVQYVKTLIDKEAAAICIEIGTHFNQIPPNIIKLAEEHDFPIIVFEQIVKFVDITQDLHTLIINQHHEMLSQLDTLSRKFISLSLTHNGILKILQELHKLFQQSTFFIDKHAKSYYYPVESKEMVDAIYKFIEFKLEDISTPEIVTVAEKSIAIMPVRGLGQTWGYICLQFTQPYAEDFLFLLLDRAALAIAQILLRNRTIEERKTNMEDELVRSLLNGRECDEADLQTCLPAMSRNMHFRVFVIQNHIQEINVNEEDWEEIKLQRSMIVRSIFKRNGFFPAVSVRKNEISIIASFLADDELKSDTARFDQVLKDILALAKNHFIDGKQNHIGISTVYGNLKDAQKGYEEACKVLSLRSIRSASSNFYEDLGIHRLLLLVNNPSYLESFVAEYLSPILEYDKQTDSNLFETLKVYLECQSSKKETSERLFIVRQTLYHRLERIEKLLGKDFTKPANRIALEVAINAYDLLHSETS